MPTQYIGLHVAHGYIQLLRNKRAEACSIQHTGHAYHAITWETANVVSKLSHRIQRIGDHDDDAIWRAADDLPGYLRNNLLVLLDEVIAAHAGLARKARGDYRTIRIAGVRIIICTRELRIGGKHLLRLEHNEQLALAQVW